MKKSLFLLILIITIAITGCGSNTNKKNDIVDINDTLKEIGNNEDENLSGTVQGNDSEIYKAKAEEVFLEYRRLWGDEEYSKAYELLTDNEKKVMPLDYLIPDKNEEFEEWTTLFMNLLNSYRDENNELIINSVDLVDNNSVKIAYTEKNLITKGLKDAIFVKIKEAISAGADLNEWIPENINILEEDADKWTRENELEFEESTNEVVIYFDSEDKGEISFGWFEKHAEMENSFKEYEANIEIVDFTIDRYEYDNENSAYLNILLKNNGNKRLENVTGILSYLIDGNVVATYPVNFGNVGPYCYNEFLDSVPTKILKAGWNDEFDIKLNGISISEDQNLVSMSNDTLIIDKIEINKYDDDIFVSGNITNKSDNPIDKVKLRIVYYDTTGTAISEVFVPVHADDGSQMLLPGLIESFTDMGLTFMFEYPNVFEVSDKVDVELWSYE